MFAVMNRLHGNKCNFVIVLQIPICDDAIIFCCQVRIVTLALVSPEQKNKSILHLPLRISFSSERRPALLLVRFSGIKRKQ